VIVISRGLWKRRFAGSEEVRVFASRYYPVTAVMRSGQRHVPPSTGDKIASAT
jgi:hypothetical protein